MSTPPQDDAQPAGEPIAGPDDTDPIGPVTLLELPLALVLAVALAFVAALGLSRLAGGIPPLQVVAWVLVGDLFCAAVLAPLAVGELGVLDAPVVFAAITALGLQPLAALAGAWVAGRGVRSPA